MALVKKETTPASSGVTRRMIAPTATVKVSLPKGIEAAPDEVSAYTYLVYGERKIGKSTLASQFSRPFFLCFEPAGRSLQCKRVQVNNWAELKAYLVLLEKDPSYCDTIVIDNANMCYNQCFEAKCAEVGLKSPRDAEGWDMPMLWKSIDREFFEVHQRLFGLGKGVVITAHAEVREFQKRDGTKTHKLSVDLGKQAFRFYAGVVDLIAYYNYDDAGGRQLTIRGDGNVEAGCRISGHFMLPDGVQMHDVPMGDVNEVDAFKRFEQAFHNKLKKEATAQKPVGGLLKKKS